MKRFALPVLLLSLCLPILQGTAQTVTGTIRGTVTDPSGAIVSGATVTATNTASSVATVTRTNDTGEYSIRFLQIGQYKIAVSASGFAAANYGPFVLEIDQTAKVDIVLSVGAATTSVEVSDQMQPILTTETATLGETLTANTIANIPLSGRDFSEVSVYTVGSVAPGFSQFGGGDSTERDIDAGNQISVDGNRQQSNNYLFDGQEINENINNTIGYNPNPDSLAEIRIITSNANAEFGNVNGGTVIAVMKSGSNQLHGSVFGFIKNYKLDANTWANDNNVIATPKSHYTTAQYGGTLGGPILKDKLFFFVDYEGMRWHSVGGTTSSVAPAAFRTGDLSSVLSVMGIQLYDTQTLDPVTNQPMAYPNNQIPITNPVALYLFGNQKAYPLPNNPVNLAVDPLGIQNNFVGPGASFSQNDQGDVKIDWQLRANDKVFFRYSQGYAADGQTADPLPVNFPTANNYPDHFFDSNWVHALSPAMVNSFTANYGRIQFNNGVSTDPSGIFGLTGNKTVGIPGNPQKTAGFSSQNFNGTGGAEYPNGFGTNPSPEIFVDNVFGYSDNLSWQKGRHLLKFGGEFLRYQQNSFYPGNDGELGAFNYDGHFSQNLYPTPNQTVTPYPFADFLLDRVQDVQIGAVSGLTGQRQWRDGIYAQDDFKVNKKLTLNLGVRWQFDQPIYEANNKMANFNMQTQQIEYAGKNGNSRALYDPVYTQFQPRFGFAYGVTSRFVVRGGYGISSYLEGTGANLRLTQNPPFHTDFEQTAVYPTPASGGTPYSKGVFYQASLGFPTSQVPTTTFYIWPKNLKPAMTQEISLTTEYQIAKASTIQVGYVEILGHHLTDPYWGNQATSPTAADPYANLVGQGGVVKITQTESASAYSALQAVFRQHITGGLELTANYTLSKAMTDNIGFYGVYNIWSGQYYQQDAYNPRAEWGPAGSDTRHNISVTGVYNLPFGRGKMLGSNSNRVVDSIIGGWKLSGSQVYYSGFPVTAASPANYSNAVNAFGGAARPNLLRPLPSHKRTIAAYYGTYVQIDPVSHKPNPGYACAPDVVSVGQNDNGTCIFQQQSDFAFGSVHPGSLRGPSFQNIDMSLAKTLTIWHEHSLDFRSDFFNAFNIADYAAPDSNVTDGNFGQITGTMNGNRSIDFSLKYAF